MLGMLAMCSMRYKCTYVKPCLILFPIHTNHTLFIYACRLTGAMLHNSVLQTLKYIQELFVMLPLT